MIVFSHATGNSFRNVDYLLACPETGEAVAIDPWDPTPLIAEAKRRGWRITTIVNTHEHFDHVHGNLKLKQQTGARILCHVGAVERVPGADSGLKAGEALAIGRSAEIEVLDTPGHTLAHVCLLVHGERPALISGDTLFNAGAGNCHNGGHPETLYGTFRDRLYPLPDETLLYPGHDYLENNLRFTLAREPGNAAAAELLAEVEQDARLRVLDLGTERRINTFFRLQEEEVQAGLARALPDRVFRTEADRFLALRELRNRW